MATHIKRIVLTGIVLGVLLSFGTIIAKNYEKPLDPYLEVLEQEKAKFINKGEKIPDGLDEKIENMRQKEIQLKAAEEERKKYHEQINKLPKDEKGNPLVDNVKPIKKGFDSFSQEEQFITEINIAEGDARHATVFGNGVGLTYKITTMAKCNYNILAAGCRKDDEETGVICNKIYSETDFVVMYEKYEYPGKGTLTFKSYEDSNNIVIFSYGKNHEGYFDVRTKTAVFEKYK